MAVVVITVPAGAVCDLPEFAALVDSFGALIDQAGAALPRRVPRPLVRALDRHRAELISLGELRLAVASVRVA